MSIEPLKDLLNPSPTGFRPLGNGEMAEMIGCGGVVVIVVADNGQLYQLSGATVSNGVINRVTNAAEFITEVRDLVLRKE